MTDEHFTLFTDILRLLESMSFIETTHLNLFISLIEYCFDCLKTIKVQKAIMSS